MSGEMKSMDYLGFLGNRGDRSKKDLYKALEKYEKCMETGEFLQAMTFQVCDNNLGLKVQEGRVEIFLPKEEISDRYIGMNKIPRRLIDRLYTVIVTDVDREAGRVTVSLKKAKAKVRPQVISEINDALESKKVYDAAAVVEAFSKNNTIAHLDINGVGIHGIINRDNWSDAIVTNIKNEASEGDVVDVRVVGKHKNYTDADPIYLCSRIGLVNGEVTWKNVESKLNVHDTVIVKCVDCKTSNWLGKIEGISDITIYGLYPEKPALSTGEPLVIEPEHSYNCYIYKMDAKRHILRVRPLDYMYRDRN